MPGTSEPGPGRDFRNLTVLDTITGEWYWQDTPETLTCLMVIGREQGEGVRKRDGTEMHLDEDSRLLSGER